MYICKACLPCLLPAASNENKVDLLLKTYTSIVALKVKVNTSHLIRPHM